MTRPRTTKPSYWLVHTLYRAQGLEKYAFVLRNIHTNQTFHKHVTVENVYTNNKIHRNMHLWNVQTNHKVKKITSLENVHTSNKNIFRNTIKYCV